jgi:hypothetical protein
MAGPPSNYDDEIMDAIVRSMQRQPGYAEDEMLPPKPGSTWFPRAYAGEELGTATPDDYDRIGEIPNALQLRKVEPLDRIVPAPPWSRYNSHEREPQYDFMDRLMMRYGYRKPGIDL